MGTLEASTEDGKKTGRPGVSELDIGVSTVRSKESTTNLDVP